MSRAAAVPQRLTALAAAVALAACETLDPPPTPPPSPPPPPVSYIVLLPNADGTVGRVAVQGASGTQQLSQPLQGADLDGARPPYPVPREQVQRDFGSALGARPQRPERFLLYFETGGARLTPESRALLPRIVQQALARTAPDISVVGHTDTQGRPEANAALGLQRATSIVQLLRQSGLQNVPISAESHGARNLLVPTPDQTPEPRNRRVEVTIR
jgi:adhesin transport system outer membrane protein